MHSRLTIFIVLAMVIGAITGWACNTLAPTPEHAATLADHFSIVSDAFLRLIKMIIAPLVFSTLAGGIAQLGRGAAIGRLALRTMTWFFGASLVSITIGLVLVDLFQPGAGLALPPTTATPELVAVKPFGLRAFTAHVIPVSIFEALATNAILQIVLFSVLTGVGLRAIGPRGEPLVRGIESLAALMLQITDYVMRLAPLAVFCAIAGTITSQGLAVLPRFGLFIGEFYVGLALLWSALAICAFAIIGGGTLQLFRLLREPLLVAFSTSSSEAAYPKTLEQIERFGVPAPIASFILPLGYSFNLDGSMMYCAFAVMFIAQAYGIEIGVAEQVTMMLLMMVTSKGMAGVPRASLVVVAATLSFLGIPEAGLLLIFGIDQFLDMGRSATNVVGNAVAAAVVAKWEGQLLPYGQPIARPDQLYEP
jgi:Na+/H+-dicarboxylate symporter